MTQPPRTPPRPQRPSRPTLDEALAAQPDWVRAELDALRKHEGRILKALEDPEKHALFVRDPAALLRALDLPVSGALRHRLRADVTRADEITVRFLDRQGQPQELRADGLLAVCIQHEMDHLDGKLFVDYLSPLKREMVRKKLAKQRKHVA